jgi:hypothetical protein
MSTPIPKDKKNHQATLKAVILLQQPLLPYVKERDKKTARLQQMKMELLKNVLPHFLYFSNRAREKKDEKERLCSRSSRPPLKN